MQGKNQGKSFQKLIFQTKIAQKKLRCCMYQFVKGEQKILAS